MQWCACVGIQVRARLLADAEEREAQRLASEALEAMLKRLQRKLNQFSALEEALVKEKAHAEVIYPVPVHHQECGMHARRFCAFWHDY